MEAIHELDETNVTKTTHVTPYPAISPLLPSLSQTGKTVLITGGGTGIGLAIAHAFVQAGSSTIIVVGRRTDVLEKACQELKASAKQVASAVSVIWQACDVRDFESIENLWKRLEEKGIVVDVLVSNAAQFSDEGKLFDLGARYVWSMFESNVKGPLFLVEMFCKQGADRSKAFVNISTQAINFASRKSAQGRLAYCLTKNSGTLTAQMIAQEIPPEKMQVVSFHPGLIWSAGWDTTGVTRDMLAFADTALPGNFAVWAASPEARFLHGRFVWSAWDIDELKTGDLRQRIDNDPDFLTIGICGLHLGKLA